ncbi:MAG: ParA family protein [Marinosulfonomonas sp.]|nr:ParA family protein [Marinosulfonomonas sp.]
MSDLTRPKRARIIAVTNQKGGVGKTTTTINLCAAMAEIGLKTMLIDLDPQGNASTGLGVEVEQREYNTYDLLLGEIPLQDIVQKTDVKGVLIVPATIDLSSADIELFSNKNRSFLLRDALHQPAIDQYDLDYILIDCPPSLNLLTVNAMVAAYSILVPLQSEFFALEGLSQLMLTVREVRQAANKNLRIEGIVLTMFDSRNRLSQQVEDDARQNMGEVVFKTIIPRNVRVSEAPSFAMPVLEYDPKSKGSLAYRQLANELVSRNAAVENSMRGRDGE